MPIDTRTITDKKFDFASARHIPHYLWIPPESLPLAETHNLRSPDPFPPENVPNCAKLADPEQTQFEGFPGEEQLDPDHGKHTLEKMPHPLSDYNHIDPTTRSGPDFGKLKQKFQAPQDKDGLDDLDFLERTVGPGAPGFQRLKLAYDLILCRTHQLLAAINDAVSGNGDYQTARENYLAFLANLDDHEPQTKDGAIEPKKGFGYGKNIKWFLIDPIIRPFTNRKTGKTYNLIDGATIIVKWNPHSSSLGVPIPHDP